MTSEKLNLWGVRLPKEAFKTLGVFGSEFETKNNALIEAGHYSNPFDNKFESSFHAKHAAGYAHQMYSATKNGAGLAVSMLTNQEGRDFVTKTILSRIDLKNLEKLKWEPLEAGSKHLPILEPRFGSINEEFEFPHMFSLVNIWSRKKNSLPETPYYLFTGVNDGLLELIYERYILKGTPEEFDQDLNIKGRPPFAFSKYCTDGVSYMNCLNFIRDIQSISDRTIFWDWAPMPSHQTLYHDLFPVIAGKVANLVVNFQGRISKEILQWMFYLYKKQAQHITKDHNLFIMGQSKLYYDFFKKNFNFGNIYLMSGDPYYCAVKGVDVNTRQVSGKTIPETYRDNILSYYNSGI